MEWGKGYAFAPGAEIDSGGLAVTFADGFAVDGAASKAAGSSFDLSDWNGTTSALPTDWTGKAGGVAVDTGNMTEPSDVGAGESRAILSADTANFFGTVTGSKAYKGNAFANDTVNGVTFSGTKYGGVKAEDSGKKLTYYGESMDTDSVSFGSMTWGEGRTAAPGYKFDNVSVLNTANFAMTYADPSQVGAGSSMTLLQANNTLRDIAAERNTKREAV